MSERKRNKKNSVRLEQCSRPSRYTQAHCWDALSISPEPICCETSTCLPPGVCLYIPRHGPPPALRPSVACKQSCLRQCCLLPVTDTQRGGRDKKFSPSKIPGDGGAAGRAKFCTFPTQTDAALRSEQMVAPEYGKTTGRV